MFSITLQSLGERGAHPESRSGTTKSCWHRACLTVGEHIQQLVRVDDGVIHGCGSLDLICEHIGLFDKNKVLTVFLATMALGLPYGPWRVLEEEPRRRPLLRLPRELKAELYDGTGEDVYCRGFEARLTTGTFFLLFANTLATGAFSSWALHTAHTSSQ